LQIGSQLACQVSFVCGPSKLELYQPAIKNI